MDHPDDRRYTTEHEWVQVEGERARVGITAFAAQALGDVVYVTLPEVGDEVRAGQPVGEVESTKSVADVYAPVDGVVAARNEALTSSPELLNSDPYGAGWVLEVTLRGEVDSATLLDAGAYTAHVAEG